MTPSLALWLLRWAQANTETLFCQITAEWLSIRNVKITYTRLYILRNNWVLFMYHYAHSNLMVIVMRECLTTLSVMNLFLTSSRTILRCIFIPFPQILSLTTEEISLPLHFSSWGSCTLQLSSLSLLSKLNKPSDFSCSSQVLLSRSFAIFVVFWMLSNSFMSFLYCSAPNCAQCWKWGCSSAGWSERIPSPDQLAVLGLINPREWLTLLAARHIIDSYETCHQSEPPVPFCRADLQLLIPLSAPVHRFDPFQVQNPGLALVKFHAVSDCPSL